MIGAYSDNTGASDTGAAYLFSTNGALLTTFTNPTPAAVEYFGISVAALGTDRVIIGAWAHDMETNFAGAAYLFNTNGTLLTTFTNPTPRSFDYFGNAVSSLGTDRVLVGTWVNEVGEGDAGTAYLFSTNGTLLTTFTNPTPVTFDYFGYSVAAMGTDRVLIGAYGDNTGVDSSGAAYLFSTGGALLTTYTNPTPATFDNFGISVTAMGTDRVLIGAFYDDTGADNAGAAYLFSTNGLLLATFTNPAPALNDRFGISVATGGAELILIGAYRNDAGATSAGAAYLFSSAARTSEPPSLTIRLPSPNTMAVSWPSPSTGWMLQENTNDVSSVNWSNAPGMIQNDGTNKTLIVNPPTGSRFIGCSNREFEPRHLDCYCAFANVSASATALSTRPP